MSVSFKEGNRNLGLVSRNRSRRYPQSRLNQLLLVAMLLMVSCAHADQTRLGAAPHAVSRQSTINRNQFFTHRLTQEDDPADADGEPVDEIEQQLENNATVKDDTANDYEKVLQNFRYFNLGFKGDDLSANFTNCANQGAYWKWIEMQTYLVKIKFGNGDENIFNSTMWLQNTTNMLTTCTDAAENIYYFVLWKKEQFPTWLDFGLGFLQNLLANVMRLNTINKRLKELKDNEKDKELYYIGVIVRMLLVFDPVAEDLARINPGDTDVINSLLVKQELAKSGSRPPLKQEVDTIGHDDRTGLEAFLTPVGMLDFLEGAITGTGLITDMTKMLSCTNIIREDFLRQSLKIYRQGAAVDVFGIFHSFYHMVWSLHPLFSDCKESPNDFTEVIKARFDDPYDGKVIMTNLIGRYSLMVDAAIDLNNFFTQDHKGQTEEGPYEAGFGMGHIVYYLLSDNPEAKMVDPADGLELAIN